MINALIRLRGCAGWSAPLLFAIKKNQDFSCLCSYDVEAQASWPQPGYAPGSRRQKGLKVTACALIYLSIIFIECWSCIIVYLLNRLSNEKIIKKNHSYFIDLFSC